LTRSFGSGFEDPEKSGWSTTSSGTRPGLRTRPHRHPSANTIEVLEGRLEVNDQVIGPGGYARFPAGENMTHGPADERSCLFVVVFDGLVDVAPEQD
jgi:quercetin dioxygenase-like cupin family protein